MKNPNDFEQFGLGCVFVGVIVFIGAMITALPTACGDPMAGLIWVALIIGLIRMVLCWAGLDN